MSEPLTPASNTKPAFWRRWWFLVGVSVGLVGLFVLFGIFALIAHPVKYEGASMEPALKDGDRLMVQKMVGELKKGDIVVFYYPMNPTKSFCKRIIALPGETISIDASGATYINNSAIDEPYVKPERNRSPRQLAKTLIAADQYFIMGDSRDVSNDSRSFGPVDRKLIYGKVIGRYWPIWR